MAIASRSPNCALKRYRSANSGLLVRVERSRGAIVRIAVSGHAGFARSGSDIVCAAVSALVLTAAHGVSAHCGAVTRVQDDEAGDYILDVPGGGGVRAQAVLESALSGLRAVARSHPAHLRVRAAGK